MDRVLIPDMPSAAELMPYLRRIDAARVYVNGGPLVRELERLISERKGCYAVVVANATQGLELALRALGLPWAMPVAVPALTFRASGLAIQAVGLRPVMVDCRPDTWAVDQGSFRGVDYSVVMPVATFGRPVREWEFPTDGHVVIDAAGALIEQEVFTDATVVCSMHATKFWGAGEGGVVLTHSSARAQDIAHMRAFGPSGTNAKMSEYHAAVALASYARLHEKMYRLTRLRVAYTHALEGLPVTIREQADVFRSSSTLMPVLLPDGHRAEGVGDLLALAGIETRQWYRPFLSELPAFRRYHPLPVTDMLRDRLIGLPLNTCVPGGMTRDDVTRICAELGRAVSGA